jgi:hypothetical protein
MQKRTRRSFADEEGSDVALLDDARFVEGDRRKKVSFVCHLFDST